MKAMLLAAGRGERMRPLTDDMPKPLLVAGGHALVDYHLCALAAAGVREVIINLSWHGERIRGHVGDGRRFGLAVSYSDEGPVALETGGGVKQALPQLGPGAFLLVNADVWTDLPFESIRLPAGSLAHLVLVENPEHHPAGDFSLDTAGNIVTEGTRLTYSGIAAMHPELFHGCQPGRFPLKPLLDRALSAGRLTGTAWTGRWLDVGTPGRLAALDRELLGGGLGHPLLATGRAQQPGAEG